MEVFIIVALVSSTVGALATPLALLIRKTYQDERRRIEAGEPRIEEEPIESASPRFSSAQAEAVEPKKSYRR